MFATKEQGAKTDLPNAECTKHKERKGIDFASHNINNKVEVEQKAI